MDEKNKNDFSRILVESLRLVEDSLSNVRNYVENSESFKNKVDIEALVSDILKKTLDLIEQIRIRAEVVYELQNLVNKQELKTIEERIKILEDKVSNLGFAKKSDLKHLERKLISIIKNSNRNKI